MHKLNALRDSNAGSVELSDDEIGLEVSTAIMSSSVKRSHQSPLSDSAKKRRLLTNKTYQSDEDDNDDDCNEDNEAAAKSLVTLFDNLESSMNSRPNPSRRLIVDSDED